MKRIVVSIHYLIFVIIFVSLNPFGKDPSWNPSEFSTGTLRNIIEMSNPVKICVICTKASPKLYSQFFQDLIPPQDVVFIDAKSYEAFVYDTIKQAWIILPSPLPSYNIKQEIKGKNEKSDEKLPDGVIIGLDKPITSSLCNKAVILQAIQEAEAQNVPILIQFSQDLSIFKNIGFSNAPIIISEKQIHPVLPESSRKELVQRATDFRNDKICGAIGGLLKFILPYSVLFYIVIMIIMHFWFFISLFLWLLSIFWFKNRLDRFSPRVFVILLIITYIVVATYAFMGWEVPLKVFLGFLCLAIYADVNCRNWRQRLMEEPFDEHTLLIRFKSNEHLSEKASSFTQALRPYLSFLTASEQTNFRFYTDHGLAHILYTLKKEAELLNWHRPKGGKLSAAENYILYCSTLIHDIGLYPLTLKGQDLPTDTIRSQHAERISEFIADKKDKLMLSSEDLEIIGKVAMYHSSKYDIKNIDVIKHRLYGKLRLELLAAILRIADACDNVRWRLPPEEIENLASKILEDKEKEKTLSEYKLHSLVDDVRINWKQGSLEILSLSSKNEFSNVDTTRERLQNELYSVQDIFCKYGIKLNQVKIISLTSSSD